MSQVREYAIKFKPRARLLLQLGHQLIRNESIALLELIKNAYDADANKVDIYLEKVEHPDQGVIIIEDDGFGMDAETIDNVWMEPGSDFKTVQFLERRGSPKYNRLPIGEKGIGRFGVHKLGSIIELTTKRKDSEEVFVSIDWEVFNDYRYLDQVPITMYVRDEPQHFKNGTTGTNIVIRNLHSKLTRGTVREIHRSLTSLISPFKTKDNFQINFDVTDHPEWLEDLMTWEKMKDFALFNFEAEIENEHLVSFKYNFTPWPTMSKLSEREVEFNDLYVSEKIKLNDQEGFPISMRNHDIGRVTFKGYVFDQDSNILKLGIQDKKTYKTYLKENGGIRVYRDGMRVYDYGEPGNDWLNLDIRRINVPAKRLSNNIVVAAAFINRNESPGLVEKTNREGFIENDAYWLLQQSLLHVIEIVETLRYKDKLRLREVYGVSRKSEPVLSLLGELQAYVGKNVDEPVKKEINKYLIKIEEDYKRLNETLLKSAGAGLSLSVVVHEVEKIILEVEKVVKSENASERLLNLVKHLASLIDGYADILRTSTRENLDLKKVINQALFNTEYRLSNHKVTVVKDYLNYKGESRVKVAKSLVVGSLMNLIDNSIHWLHRADRPDKTLYFGLFDEKNIIYLIVADNGTGFTLPTADLTEPFVSAKSGGIGLGLYITQEIMQAHGGTLTFPDLNDFQIPQEFAGGAIVALGFKK